MMGKKRWEQFRRDELRIRGGSVGDDERSEAQRIFARPENPLERHPREGGDVKLHHLYYLKVTRPWS